MPALSRTILLHRNYLIAFITCTIIATLFVSSGTKIDGFIKLNAVHNRYMDIVFSLLTLLGDGLFSIFSALIIFVAWKNQRLALQIVIAFLLSGIMAQVFKNMIAAPRPKEIIDPILYAGFFKGHTSAGWDSFPSGHTTSIFALATLLALHIYRKWCSLLLLSIAMLVGYSRVYTGSHFPADVIAGALLGTITSIFVYTFINLKQGTLKHKPATDHVYSSPLTGN